MDYIIENIQEKILKVCFLLVCVFAIIVFQSAHYYFPWLILHYIAHAHPECVYQCIFCTAHMWLPIDHIYVIFHHRASGGHYFFSAISQYSPNLWVFQFAGLLGTTINWSLSGIWMSDNKNVKIAANGYDFYLISTIISDVSDQPIFKMATILKNHPFFLLYDYFVTATK